VAEDTGVLLSRTLLTNFATKTLVRVSDASAICVGEYALERVSHRSVNFDVQVTAISECVANAYERNQEWAKAAAMLKRIALDTTHRHMTVAQRLQMFLRVTSLYLKENDIAMAEDAINRAAMIAPDGTSATKDPAFTTVQPGHSLSLEMLYMVGVSMAGVSMGGVSMLGVSMGGVSMLGVSMVGVSMAGVARAIKYPAFTTV
ncbi:hypothetical protein SARC_05122, partial [Sphaeroforma arctica JP610]